MITGEGPADGTNARDGTAGTLGRAIIKARDHP
jgi:hypothetical protein